MKTVGIVTNSKRMEAPVVVKNVLNWLKKKKIKFWIDNETSILINLNENVSNREMLPKKVDLILVLGGDGTLLNIARYAAPHNVPILAVNLGSLGFITEIKIEEVFQALDEALKENYSIEKRMMLQGSVIRQNKTVQKYLALNDIVISKEIISRIIHIETYIDMKYVTTYHADGLIISSPTGSTAYSLSAGGPIVHPCMDALVLSPICPHTLTNRPLIVPPEDRIDLIIKAIEQNVVLTIDGQIIFHLIPGDKVRISRARPRLKLIVPGNRNYYEVLRNKLKWGGAVKTS